MGTMRDIQRERLKHLLASAILELWKKETGSLSSVIIEGTICITSGTGKTTVLQVADKFSGSIPEADDGSPGYSGGRMRYSGAHGNHVGPGTLAPPTYTEAPRVDCQNPAAMAAFLDNLSPASLVSPVTDYSRSSRESRSPSIPRNQEQPMDISVKEETPSESGSDSTNDGKTGTPTSERGTGGIIPGTGYYTCTTPESEDRSSKDDLSPQSSALNLSSASERLGSDSLSREGESPEARESRTRDKREGSTSRDTPIDMSEGKPRTPPSDLALSPPQSYTAQVRDVIRQRLLAAKNGGVSPEELKKEDLSPLSEYKHAGLNNNIEKEELDVHSVRNMPSPQSNPSLTRKSPVTFADHLPPHGVQLVSPVSSGMVSPYSRNMTTSVAVQSPLLFGRAGMTVLNGPLHSILNKHKPRSLTPNMRHSPSPHDAPISPIFPGPQTPPTMVPLRENSLPEGAGEPNSPDGSPSEKDANGEQRVYKCEFCTKTFLFKSKYHEHLPVHTNARPFQCHLCSRTYKYKYDLRVHLRTHMGIPTKSTICPFCSGKFDTNKMLRLHIKEAHRDKQKVSEEECTQSNDNLPPAL